MSAIDHCVCSLASTRRVGLIAVAIALVAATPARATQVYWNVDVSGSWHTPSNWSTGVVPGPTDTVIINRAVALTVTYSQGPTSIMRLECDESLTLSGGSLTVSNLVLVNGTFRLQGGTLTAAEVAATVSYASPGGTLNGVILNGDLNPTASGSVVTVTSGLTLNGTARVGIGTEYATLNFSGTQTLGGTGQVVFSSGTYNVVQPTTNGTLTIGPGITIRGARGTVGAAALAFVNQGVIKADTVNVAGITLTGTNWCNNGVIEARDSGTLSLGGSFTRLCLGDFRGVTGVVRITGTLDNTASTLALTAATGSPQLVGGTIVGGRVTGTGGAVLLYTTSGTLSGVTLDADLNPTASGSVVTMTNGLTLNGTARVGIGTEYATLNFSGTQTLGGTGQVVFSNNTNNVVQPTTNGTLTIGPGITIRGARGTVGAAALAFVNQGVIKADTANVAGITLTGTNWCNNGVIEARDSGTLSLGGSFTRLCLGDFRGVTGVVRITGTLDNTASTLALTATTGSPQLVGGTIVGGRVTGTGGAVLLYTTSGTLSGVTLDADLNPTASGSVVTMTNGLTLNGTARVGIGTEYATLNFSGTQTLGGTGQVVFSNNTNNVVQPTTNGTLTIGPGITIRGARGTVGAAALAFVNQGVIKADTANVAGITLTGTNWCNNGVIEARDSGTLSLGGSFTRLCLGDFRGVTGVVRITGTLDNTASTLALTATTGSPQLVGGTIVGGRVTGTGGAVLLYTTSGTLSGVTLDADLNPTASGSVVTMTNGLTLNGTARVGIGTQYATLNFSGTQTLGGTGQVVFSNNTNNVVQPTTNGTLTIGPSITIRGQQGTVGATTLAFVSQGVINADMAGAVITLSGTNWSNPAPGVIEATGLGSTLNLGGSFTTAGLGDFRGVTGVVRITGTLDNTASTLALTAATGSPQLVGGTIVGGRVTGTGGAVLLYTTSGTLSGVTLDADLNPTASGSVVTMTNGLTLNGTARVGIGTQYATLNFSGTQTLGGTGQVVFSNAANVVQPTAGTLTIGPGITIRGQQGTVGATTLAFVNQGVIDADMAGAVITLVGTNWESPTPGAIRATGLASTLNLDGSFTTAALGDFSGVYGVVRIRGALNNAGDTLALTAATGSPQLVGGTIVGGNVTGADQAVLLYTSSGGALNGVTLDGDLNPTGPGTPYVTVTNGLVLNGTARVGFGTQAARFDFSGNQTLDGTGQVVFSNAANVVRPTAGTLTIGPGITIRGQQGTLGLQTQGFLNHGRISAEVAGFTISLSGTNWVNDGTLVAPTNGGNLSSVAPSPLTNADSVFVGSGSRFDVGGSYTQTAGKTILSSGTIAANPTVDLQGGQLSMRAGNDPTARSGRLAATTFRRIVLRCTWNSVGGCLGSSIDLTSLGAPILVARWMLLLGTSCPTSGTCSISSATGRAPQPTPLQP